MSLNSIELMHLAVLRYYATEIEEDIYVDEQTMPAQIWLHYKLKQLEEKDNE
jgi:hypothetical protein